MDTDHIAIFIDGGAVIVLAAPYRSKSEITLGEKREMMGVRALLVSCSAFRFGWTRWAVRHGAALQRLGPAIEPKPSTTGTPY